MLTRDKSCPMNLLMIFQIATGLSSYFNGSYFLAVCGLMKTWDPRNSFSTTELNKD